MKKHYFLIAIFVFSIAITSIFLTSGIIANAEGNYTASFYVYRGEPAIEVITEQSGWKFPELETIREGYEFVGWYKENDLTIYSPGDTFNGTLDENVVYYAAWTEVFPERNTGGIYFTTGEKIAIICAVSVMLFLIAFAYHWFVIKKRSFKDLFKRKPKEK